MKDWNVGGGHDFLMVTVVMLLLLAVDLLALVGLAVWAGLSSSLSAWICTLVPLGGGLALALFHAPRQPVSLKRSDGTEVNSISEAPSADLLFYLFADRIVPRSWVRTSYARVPCRNTSVKRSALGGSLFASAFWSLREQGLVALQLVQNGKKSEVSVVPLKRAERRGLERDILRAVADGNGSSVGDIVKVWFETPTRDRNRIVVEAVMQEAVNLGYVAIVDAQRAGLSTWVWGKAIATANCEKIDRLAGEFERLKASWRSFQQQEPELHAALMQQCMQTVAGWS